MDISKITTNATKNVRNAGIEKTQKSSAQKFSLGDDFSPKAASMVNSEININFLDALFLDVEQQKKSKKQEIEKAEKVLDLLDDLRVAIVSGLVPRHVLENISSLVEKNHSFHADEKLKTILLEVETRAKVELAKLAKHS